MRSSVPCNITLKRSHKTSITLLLQIVSSTAVFSAVDAHDFLGVGGGWNLPPVQRTQRNKDHFLDQCDETLASFFNKVSRGGSSYSNNNDDYYWGEQRQGSYRYDNDYYQDKGDKKNNYDSSYSARKRGDYYDDYENDFYDGVDRKQSKPSQSPFPAIPSSMPSALKNGNLKIGISMLASGTAITFLGFSLFFNKTLMRLGNLLFVAGIPMTIGPTKAASYFLDPKKIRATGCLLLGIFLVFVGHPIFGIALEVFGLLNLFGNMFPFLLAVGKQVPIVGDLLSNFDGSKKNKKKPSKQRNDYDDYDDYEQQYYDDSQRDDSYNDFDYGRSYDNRY